LLHSKNAKTLNPIRGCRKLFTYYPRLHRGLFILNPCGIFNRTVLTAECVEKNSSTDLIFSFFLKNTEGPPSPLFFHIGYFFFKKNEEVKGALI
jgi:hypothetical protein